MSRWGAPRAPLLLPWVEPGGLRSSRNQHLDPEGRAGGEAGAPGSQNVNIPLPVAKAPVPTPRGPAPRSRAGTHTHRPAPIRPRSSSSS